MKRVLKGSVEGVGKLEKEFTLLHELTNLNENVSLARYADISGWREYDRVAKVLQHHRPAHGNPYLSIAISPVICTQSCA